MKILQIVIACIIAGTGGGIGFIYSGIYDVSAIEPDNAIVHWTLHTTSDRSVGASFGGISVPPGLDNPQVILSGGHLFAENCLVCRGGPGLKPTNIAQGLNPRPLNLFRATRKPGMEEMFRFILYGVKMTALPGFGTTHTDDQIWQLAAFMRKAPGMSPEEFAAQTGTTAPRPAEAKPADS